MSEDRSKLLVRVDVPDIKTQKCVVLSLTETVWAAKQVVLDKLNQDLPHNLLNYSLYLLPSVPGKLGKYMDDGRALRDYVLHGHVPRLEMRYKRRDYSIQVSLKEKDIIKANSKANHRKFVEHVVQGSVKKVEKMLDTGVDPNFITEDGNTPLGLACGRNSNIQVIMPLLSNGAHIDFRGKDGLTPLHRAALGGNSAAIKILLSYGASPNYRDVKGLTPLYHTAIMGDDTSCCESLLRYRAELGVRDHGGWTELHQVSKHGHLEHADMLIRYGADLHAQNNAGNTPLHVAASHGQARCALLLLRRGADKTKLNFSSQMPAQVAILCGHHSISAEINSFRPDEVDLIKNPPAYHPNARVFDPKLFSEQTRAEVCPVSPPVEALVDTLTQEWTEKDVESSEDALSEAVWPKVGSSHSIPSMSGTVQLRGYQQHQSLDTADSESLSSLDRDSIHSTSTAGTGTPGQNTPQTFPKRQPTFATQRERLYRAGPGRYVATDNVEPQQSDDIPLRKGMEVEVVFIGKGGYWEGRAGGRQGWFPAKAIKDMDDEDSGVYVEPTARATNLPGMAMTSVSQYHPQPVPTLEVEEERVRVEREGMGRNVDVKPPQKAAFDKHLDTHSTEQRMTNIKEVIVYRGIKGYGFAMRGVKATKTMKFHPTPQVPALQYIGNVEAGGSAEIAGLKTGDFLLEINGHSVVHSTHDDVVDIIRKAGSSLRIKVITPLSNPSMRTSIQLQKQVEISNSSPATERRDGPSTDPLPVKLEASRKPSGLSGLDEQPERETVIDGGPSYRGRGGESPSLDRIHQMGWDSSQSQDEESIHTPTSQGQPEKFSYLSPTAAYSTSPTKIEAPKLRSLTPPPTTSSDVPKPAGYKRDAPRNVYGKAATARGATLPALPMKDYPQFVRSSQSSESDEESDFTQALKKGREKLSTSPSQRHRSNTMPSRENHSLTSSNSSLEAQLKEVKQKWSTAPGQSATRSRIKHTKSDTTPISYNQPLVAAIMRKIDSVQIEHSDEFSSDEEEEQIRPRAQLPSKERSPPPPPVRPKPQFRRAHTVDLTSTTGKEEDNTIGPLSNGADTAQPSPPWAASFKKSTGPKESIKEEPEESQEQTDGVMNWKSVLRPVKRTESGRACEGPAPLDQNKSSGSKQPVRQVHPNPKATSPVAKVFENEVKKQKDVTGDAATANSGRETLQLYEPAKASVTSSAMHKTAVQGSFDESYWSTEASNKQATPKAPPLKNQVSMESELLPPPLPPVDNRLSAEFIDLPPPVNFVSITGANCGESSTDDFIPPPMQDEFDGGPPSPLPPPPPSSSPPREPLDSSKFDGIKFPTPEKEKESQEPHPEGDMKVPPPLPSPLQPSSFDADMESEMLLPPQEFNQGRDRAKQDEVGFELPSPQSNLHFLPPPSGKAESKEEDKDLEQMIQQLQQLSNNLDTTASEPSKEKLGPVPGASEKIENTQGEKQSMKTTTSTSSMQAHPEGKDAASNLPVTSRTDADITPNKVPTTTSAYSGKEMEEWDVDDVCNWLVDIGLGEHCSQFKENEILGEHLQDLTKEELTELGVKKIGHKKTFLTKVKEFNICS